MKAKWISIGVNVCRFIVALTFIFSGFVKAIDPLGTQYKINDYLQALGCEGIVPPIVTLGISVLLSAVEFYTGMMLLFAIRMASPMRLRSLFARLLFAKRYCMK